MKEKVLILIKPDGISRYLAGHILTRLAEARLEIIASRAVQVSRALAEEHYKHLKGQPFFEEVISFIQGKHHPQKYVLAFIFYGKDAIRKCRRLAGATNPEEADPASIRGSCGRVTTKGDFENLLHVSSDKKEAEREIKLWFQPDDIIVELFPSKQKTFKKFSKGVWS